MAIRVLSTQQVQAILKRMAYQILERNFEVAQLELVGVSVRGRQLAQQLSQQLQLLTTKPVLLHTESGTATQGEVLIVVDDVLYTGRTLFDALAVYSASTWQGIQLAILIDRGHRHFPVSADFLGFSLGTTLQEYVHVEVDASGTNIEAFLS